MTNPTTVYNTYVRANLPSGMTYSGNRYRYNGKSFFTYKEAAWYRSYLLKVGGAISVTMTPMLASFGSTMTAGAATHLPAGTYAYSLVSAPAEATASTVNASTGRMTTTMPASGTLSAPFIIRAVGASTYDLSLTVTPRSVWAYTGVVAVGDSITVNGDWVADVSGTWGATHDNQAISGTVLQNTLSKDDSNPLSQNLMDTFVARSITPTGTAIISAYGFNDARYNYVGDRFNSAKYLSDYRTILARWMVRYGRDNIWLVTPHYISDVGLTTAANPDFAGRTREWFYSYVTAARTLSAEFGVKLVDTYELGVPAETSDNIHPTNPEYDRIGEAFVAPKLSALASSTLTPYGAVEAIVVPVGVVGYVVSANAQTYIALVEGSNTFAAGDHIVVWSDGGLWEQSTITATPAAVADPTAGMTSGVTWSPNTAYGTLKPTVTKMTAKFSVTRSAGDYGVLFEMGGTSYGGYAIVYNDAGTDRLKVLMGYANGSYASAADLGVITMVAPTGTFEVIISGDSITGQKVALYIDRVLISTDAVSASYLSGGRDGGIGQVYDQIPANPTGWSSDGDGINTMVTSATVWSGQATADTA